MISLFLLIITLSVITSPCNALTRDDVKNYIGKTWSVKSVGDDALTVLLQKDYPDTSVGWNTVIGGLIASDQVFEDIRQGRNDQAAYNALSWGSKQAFSSSLAAIGFQSVAAVASLAGLPIEAALLRFKKDADRLGFLNQQKLYFAAKRLGLSEDQILNGEEAPDSTMQYDRGWLFIVGDLHSSDLAGRPSNLTVKQTYDICEAEWNLKQKAPSYDAEKAAIGKKLISELQRIAGDEYHPTDQTKTAQPKKKGGLLGNIGGILDKIKIPKIKLPDILNPGPGRTKASSSANSDNPVSSLSTKDIPILLGKSRNEIEAIFGTTPVMLNTFDMKTYNSMPFDRNNNTYIYGKWPAKYYMTTIDFSPNGEMSNGLKNNVYSVAVRYEYSSYDTAMEYYLRPEQIVPPQVLNHKCDEINRSLGENAIDVVWHVDGKTYVLTACDVPSRPLYATKAEHGGETAIANKNTTDFRSDYVLGFSYTDAIVTPHHYYGSPLLRNLTEAEIKEDLVTKGTGYKNLIGLDFKGVLARMGRQPNKTWNGSSSVVSYCTLGWGYNGNPLIGYNTTIHFEHYRNLGDGETFKIVHYVDVACQDKKLAVPPQKIVPVAILASEPQQILWWGDGNNTCIAVIWLRDGCTYCLGLYDSHQAVVEQRQVLNDQGLFETRVYLTAAGRNFRNCNRSLFFVCIDRDTDFFAPTSAIDTYTPVELRRGFVGYGSLGCEVYRFKN